MKHDNHRNGATLIALALFFAVIGILFGLGRLKMHEYQVKRRIERTYQVEKILATRSLDTMILRTVPVPNSTGIGETEQFISFTNRLTSKNSKETLICCATPVPYKEIMDMAPSSFYSSTEQKDGVPVPVTNWVRYPLKPSLEPHIKPVQQDDKKYVEFKVENPVSNVVYKGAICKDTQDSWLNAEFGYFYGFRMVGSDPNTGFGKARLYLVGSDDREAFTGKTRDYSYTNQLNKMSWFQVEYTHKTVGGAFQAVRNVRFHQGLSAEVGSTLLLEDIHMTNEYVATVFNESFIHEGGLLLHRNHMVVYAKDADSQLAFTQRYDIAKYTNDFKNVWLVLENEFLPLEQMPIGSETNMTVEIATVTVKEPLTYSLSVYNANMINSADIQPTTWLLLTTFANSTGTRPCKRCILDTFGLEPVSLRKERRGECVR